ncbi:MAG TPA: 2Fe-2S iron-sulfur cluster-binding protein [Saprospiraceae bacterium]|nr:2Fe-2S iron-sulfur cluster-binding protein [Saprospiraceae bacterium]
MDLNLKLKIWRQKNNTTGGHFETYDVVANEHMSFLEMLDVLNEDLVNKREAPVAFEHDCREGICGTCSLTINGQPHGPNAGTTACQLHMRYFKDGETITVEPFRAGAFPVVKDLVVDRGALDRIVQAGGFVSVNAGQMEMLFL